MIINNLDFEFYTGTDKLDLIKDNISKLSKISDKALYKVNYLKRALKEIIQNDNDINDDDDCEMLEVNDLNNIHKLSLNEDSEILNFTNGKIGQLTNIFIFILIIEFCERFTNHIESNKIENQFDNKNNKYLSSYDFSWKDQGIYVLSELDKTKIELINKEIQSIIDFTTGGFCEEDNKEKIDTFLLRQAIDRYVEKLMGIFHEDYNYSIMNKLLDEDTKKLIKSFLFYSKKMSKEELVSLDLPFNSQEIVQLLLVAANLKHRICLTYISYAFDSFTKDIQ